jgi:transposase
MDKIIRIRRSEYEQMQQELATLRKLPAVVEQLEAKIASLAATIALLKGGKDSRTSSTAPSHDFGRSNEISLRTPSGKKSGGQPGHRGYTHLLSDNPDEIIDHHPSVCTHCGKDLQGVNSTSFTGRQLVDIPPISPIYIEHRSHVKNCPSCGCKNCGAFPEHICAPLQYGSQVEAMVGYLSVFQTIPYKRICVLFKDFFNLHLSEGTVDNFLERLAQKANPVYETIRKKIQQSEIVGSDETGCRVNGKKYWFHVWQNNLLTFIVAFASRGYEVIGKYFPDGFIHSFYISDCWNAQLKVIAKVHQLCMAHLLRELINFEKNLKSEWSAKMKDLFQRAIELKKKMTEEDYLKPPKEVAQFIEELDQLLTINYEEFHQREQAFVKRMIKHRKSIFTFLKYQNVPPDNNASERAIRNVKVKTKVSGQFRNENGKGADRYAKIRSVIDTTIKNGQDVYTALVCLANCKIVKVEE